MKKFVILIILIASLPITSHAVSFTCTHDENTGNPHYQSWTTNYHANDVDSASNAATACSNNGGRISFRMELSDLFAFFY